MINKKMLILFFSVHIFICHKALSQNVFSIQGKVLDENGNTMPWATVFVDKSRIFSTTNNNGDFILKVPSNTDSVKVSFVGYKTTALKVEKCKKLLIKMEPYALVLEKVVITGFTPEDLIKQAIKDIPKNYATEPFLTESFYRLKVYKKDSICYFEEAAFNIIKSYKSGFEDILFVEKNRNFFLRKEFENKRFTGLMERDIVKEAHSYFDASFFRSNTIKFENPTIYDNSEVYVLSVKPKNKEDKNLRIYIDRASKAFVKLESDYYKVLYKKINDKYFLINSVQHGYVVYPFKGKGEPIVGELTTTSIKENFNKDSIQGMQLIPRQPLSTYVCNDNDTLFWSKHNQVLPDKEIVALQDVIAAKIKEKPIDFRKNNMPEKGEKHYTPNLQIWYVPIHSFDNGLFIKNLLAFNRFGEYMLAKKAHPIVSFLAEGIYHYFVSSPFHEAWAEKYLLKKAEIESKMFPVSINKFGKSYNYGVSNEQLNALKNTAYFDFMRLHTSRIESGYVAAFNISEELAQYDFDNAKKNNLYLLTHYLEFSIRKTSGYASFFVKDKTNLSYDSNHPLFIDYGRSFVKYLHEKNTDFKEKILNTDLTSEELKYYKALKWKRYLNYLSPYVIGINYIKISDKIKLKFDVNYLLTPFGEMYEQDFWLKTKRNLSGIFLRQYVSHSTVGYGVGYKHYNIKLLDNLYTNANINIWCQPESLQFYDQKLMWGGSINQTFEYKFLNNKYIKNRKDLSLYLGYNIKTKGYEPHIFTTNRNVNIMVGIKYNIGR